MGRNAQHLTRHRAAGGCSPLKGWPILSALIVALLISGLAAPAVGFAQEATPAAATPDAVAAIAPLPTAAAVPADAIQYAVFNLDQSTAQWEQARELAKRAGADDVASLANVVLEGTGDLTGRLGLDLGDVARQISGEVAIVTLAKPSVVSSVADAIDEAAPGVADVLTNADRLNTARVAVIAADNPNAAYILGTALVLLGSATGVSVPSAMKVEDVTITYTGGGGGLPGLAVARVGDLVLVSNDAGAMEPVIRTALGSSPSIETLDGYNAVRAEMPEDFLYFGFTDGPATLDSVEEAVDAVLGVDEPADVTSPETLGVFGVVVGDMVRATEVGFRYDTVAISSDGTPLPPAVDDFTPETDEVNPPEDEVTFIDGSEPGFERLTDTITQLVNADIPLVGTVELIVTIDREPDKEAIIRVDLNLGGRVFDVAVGTRYLEYSTLEELEAADSAVAGELADAIDSGFDAGYFVDLSGVLATAGSADDSAADFTSGILAYAATRYETETIHRTNRLLLIADDQG